MKKQAVIFDSSWQNPKPRLLAKVQFNKLFYLSRFKLRFLGRCLVVISFALIIMTFTPLMAAEVKTKIKQIARLTGLKPQVQSKSGFAYLLNQELPPAEDQRFQLVIPKLDIDESITANVEANKKSEYEPALKKGIAHSKGSGLPGEKSYTKTVYLFAHSTDTQAHIKIYNAIFYQLKDLQLEDRIIVWFWGKKFVYLVEKKEILAKSNTKYFQPQKEKDQLVLQTCWPPGTSLKQLVVVAKLAT